MPVNPSSDSKARPLAPQDFFLIMILHLELEFQAVSSKYFQNSQINISFFDDSNTCR